MKRCVTLLLLLTACTEAGNPSTAASAPPTNPPTTDAPASPTTVGPTRLDHFVEEASYGPDIVEIYAPSELGDWPVLVLFHGGAWVTGDVRDTANLANELAARGVVVFNASYRTMPEGGSFPGMVDDVACAFGYARSRAGEYTRSEGPIVIGGHSAGAHLSALVALAPDEFGSGCATPMDAPPDGYLGLAGPYDIAGLGGVLAPFFGVEQSEDPDVWSRGNPIARTSEAAIPMLLIHGTADELVPVTVAEAFADALTAAGDPPRLEIIEGENHGGAAEPVIVNDLVLDFLASLSPG